MSYRTTSVHICTVAEPVVVTAVGEVEEPVLTGWSYFKDDKFEEAVSDFDAALELDPNRSEAHAGRAIALAMLGRDDAASLALRRAVDLDVEVLGQLPDEDAVRAAIAHLGNEYRKQAGNADEPIDLWFMIAALETAKGDYASARSAIDTAIEAGDTQPSTTSLKHHLENATTPA